MSSPTYKSIFIPYKTNFGITKYIYNLKKEQKPIKKILSKDKTIYKYENKNKKNINSVSNPKEEESIKKEDKINNDIIYKKRFSNFNKIIEDYKNKKYKNKNNYLNKQANKNKIIIKNQKDREKIFNKNITSHKYFNSKKIDINNNNNNFNNIIIKQNNFIKEKVSNIEYNNSILNNKKKNSIFIISYESQLIIKAINKKSDKNEAQELKDIIQNINQKEENFIKNNFRKNPIYNINNSLYPYININNFDNKKYFFNKIITNNETYNNIVNINKNNNIHSINDINFLLNKKIGIPLYFYPYCLKSNSIMMSIYINSNIIFNSSFFIKSYCNSQMIHFYYQGMNKYNNNKKTKYFKNLNKNIIGNNIMTPLNPNFYYLFKNKFGINFVPTNNNNKINR